MGEPLDDDDRRADEEELLGTELVADVRAILGESNGEDAAEVTEVEVEE